MLTLDKIAGYSEDNLVEKVAEAMDFLEANDVDPIGGLTALMNVDAEGNPTDEKVASELNKIAEFQLDALAKVAEYLAGENPEDIAKIALDLESNAAKVEKVAEAMDYLEANNINGLDGMIIAANVTPDGQFADEKIAYEVANAGYTDADFSKIAKAIDYLGQNGISFDEALDTAAMLKEAAPSAAEVQAAGRGLDAVGSAIKSKAKGLWNSYKAALTGKGAKTVQNRIKQNEDLLAGENAKLERYKALGNKGKVKAYKKSEQIKGIKGNVERDKHSLSKIKSKQVKTVAGTAALGAGALGYGGYKLSQ